VEDPARAPRGIRDDKIGAFSVQQRPELAAHQPGESLDGYQEVAARRVPGGGVLGDAAATDEAMNMRVETPTPTIP
jgi:hypothetical protein